MTSVTHSGSGNIIAKLAFVSLLAAGFNLSAITKCEVAAGEEFTFQSPNHVYNSENYELVVNAGATVQFPPSGNIYAFVYLKGSGTVTFKKPDGYQGGDQATFFRGFAADSTVSVIVKDVTTVNIGQANPANNISYPVIDVANMTFEQSGGKLRLIDKTTVRALPSSFEVAPGATVALQGTNPNPLGLGSSFTLTDYDVVVLNRASIPNGCTITVSPGRTLGLKPANTATRDISTASPSTYKWNWSGINSYFDESFNIVLGGKGARVVCRNVNNLNLFTPVTGVGEVVFWPDRSTADSSTLLFRGKFYTAAYKAGSGIRDAYPVSIPVNTAVEPPPSDTWQDKVTHWFDASDASTIVPFTFDPNAAFGWSGAKNEYNGHQIVIAWKDKKSDLSFYNKRIWTNYSGNFTNDYVLQVMPYLVEGGLNGKSYLGFGTFGDNVPNAKYDKTGKLVSVTESRRLPLWSGDTPGDTKFSSGAETTINPKYCIMVFGSQQGGGKAILGDDISKAGNGNLARNTSSISQSWLAYNGYSMLVDGVEANPKSAKPSGDWQIVSLDMTATNTVINGVGNHGGTGSSCGGQNYAEIIFFDSAPTDAERKACEAYLAEKWGLKSTYSFRAGSETFSELSGGEGTTMEIRDYRASDCRVVFKTGLA